MDEQPKAAEAFVYLDARFKLQAAGDSFLISDEMLLDAFERHDKAAAYFAARGGDLQRSHDGMHVLRKRPNATSHRGAACGASGGLPGWPAADEAEKR